MDIVKKLPFGLIKTRKRYDLISWSLFLNRVSPGGEQTGKTRRYPVLEYSIVSITGSLAGIPPVGKNQEPFLTSGVRLS
jgi:hypothetical protein